MTSSSSNKGPSHNKSIYGIYVKELKYAKITFFEDKVEKVYKKRKESLIDFATEVHRQRIASDLKLAVPILSVNEENNSYIMPRLKEIIRIDKKLILKVLDLIEKLHRIGYSHGDVRIPNILQDDNGDIYFIDFEYSKSLTLYSNIINKKKYMKHDYSKLFYFLYDHGYSEIEWLQNYLIHNNFLDEDYFDSPELTSYQSTNNYLYYGNLTELNNRQCMNIYPTIEPDFFKEILSCNDYFWEDDKLTEKQKLFTWIFEHMKDISLHTVIYNCIINLRLDILLIVKEAYFINFNMTDDIDIHNLNSLSFEDAREFLNWLKDNFGPMSDRNKQFILDDLEKNKASEYYIIFS